MRRLGMLAQAGPAAQVRVFERDLGVVLLAISRTIARPSPEPSTSVPSER